MASRLYTQATNTRIQTSAATAPAQGMFQSRPFEVRSNSTTQSQQQPDLKTSLMQAERYGHHLSRMHPAGVSAPQAVQPKMGMGQPVQLERAEAPQVLQASFPFQDLPESARNSLFSNLSGRDIGNLRQTNTANRNAVDEHFRNQVPYSSRHAFGFATSGHFREPFNPPWSRGGAISPDAQRTTAWNVYQNTGNIPAGQPAYLGRRQDQGPLMNQSRFTSTHQVLNVGGWSPQVNDAWTLRSLHDNRPFHLLSNPSASLWETNHNRPTVTGREVNQAINQGYTPASPNPQHVPRPFTAGGVALIPDNQRPQRQPARISDAVPDRGTQNRLDNFQQQASSLYQPLTSPPGLSTGGRGGRGGGRGRGRGGSNLSQPSTSPPGLSTGGRGGRGGGRGRGRGRGRGI